MKLFSSFLKELKIASRGFYFYIEIFMALLILAIFLFAVPDSFNTTTTEYIYLDMPDEASEGYLEALQDEMTDDQVEDVTLTIDDQEKVAVLYTTEETEIYILNSQEDARAIAEEEQEVSAVIALDDENNLDYTYYLQGYESDKYKNLLKILNVDSTVNVEEIIENQDVRALSTNIEALSDRESILPTVLVFNGALMGLFIIAAYIFLDRQEGVIKAYAVTPSPVWQYLMSKIGVLLLTTIVSSYLVIIPLMQLQPDYLLMLVLLVTTAFFASSLGLLIASFYSNIMQSFGVLYVVMMLMILPSIAFFIPSWSPAWISFIPSYPMMEGFRSILLGNNDWPYILTVSGVFLLTGSALFALSNYRYKKTLLG
ncbi:ABC-type multidrug transport system, permease component [Alkalibacterium subtropicum]|uniref:ABC-type multidrug transport system, permease component n=1 Tax=Alkalibacterium subtropicum TaxID=753702 RepID=A0A1I1FW14_9LACT|nr:ABC transporter permease [Alkalibacterium subtropicum]SFC01170.1 ABC-type multidrug transport system, permease component [Alkalibacterium subtropicum]